MCALYVENYVLGVRVNFLILLLQVGEPGKLLGVDEIVSGLEKLGESPEVTNSLRQYLRPAFATLPMYGLSSISSAVFVILSTFQEAPARASCRW